MTDTQVKKELNVGDTIYLRERDRNRDYYYSTIVSRVTNCRAYVAHPVYKERIVCVNRQIGENNTLDEFPSPKKYGYGRWDNRWLVGEETEKKYKKQIEEEERAKIIKQIQEKITTLSDTKLTELTAWLERGSE